MKGEKRMKIALYSSTDNNFLYKFAEIAKKYAKGNIVTITKHQQFREDDYYINFEVDSLEFLPKLEQDVCALNNSSYSLIFSTFEEGFYGINIYDGYLD